MVAFRSRGKLFMRDRENWGCLTGGVPPNSLRLMSLTMRHCLFAVAAAAVLAGCSPKESVSLEPGTMPPPATKSAITYAQDIKPIFDNSCIKCHGEDKQKAKLRLDTRESILQGSQDGPIFEVGKSGESVLVANVARLGDVDDWMPPVDKGKPLTKEQVALIRAWIDQGAK